MGVRLNGSTARLNRMREDPVPSLRDWVQNSDFTQDLRPGLTDVAALRLGFGAFGSTVFLQVEVLTYIFRMKF